MDVMAELICQMHEKIQSHIDNLADIVKRSVPHGSTVQTSHIIALQEHILGNEKVEQDNRAKVHAPLDYKQIVDAVLSKRAPTIDI